jgi:2-polyprenyl-6-methoxyphenol hydroxylase-like FAD-dependent oxidoreductase
VVRAGARRAVYEDARPLDSGVGFDDATLPLAVEARRSLPIARVLSPMGSCELCGVVRHGCAEQSNGQLTKAARTLARDDGFNFRTVHWGDLHRRLHEALPTTVTVLWGHQFQSFEAAGDKRGVVATVRVLQTGETVEVTGDLLVKEDGSTSSIRRRFLPNLKLRSYSVA